MGDALQGMSFEGILEDTQRHYEERGGVEKKRQELGPGQGALHVLAGDGR